MAYRILVCGVLLIGLAPAVFTQSPPKKILVAHRGASGYAPEHTAAAYELAITQGADFVEQDLAVTKDGVLVSIHDLTLERTTNVEEVFPTRFVELKDGPMAGKHWLVNDFTLAEIKQLDAGSWFDPKYAGQRILTFQECIDLVRKKPGIGIYPELKDPEFYRQRGVAPEQLFAAIVRKNNLLADPKMPVILQSFDATTLQNAAKEIPQVPRVYLVAPQQAAVLDSADKVKAIAAWATGLGPNKIIVDRNPALVTWAHANSLSVTPWTFRTSDKGSYPTLTDEMRHFLYKLGVDALFTDYPDQFPRTER